MAVRPDGYIGFRSQIAETSQLTRLARLHRGLKSGRRYR